MSPNAFIYTRRSTHQTMTLKRCTVSRHRQEADLSIGLKTLMFFVLGGTCIWPIKMNHVILQYSAVYVFLTSFLGSELMKLESKVASRCPPRRFSYIDVPPTQP